MRTSSSSAPAASSIPSIGPRRSELEGRQDVCPRERSQGIRAMPSVNRRVLPGFSLSLGYSVFYLSILVLLPIAACFAKAASLSLEEFWDAVWTERARAAYAL